MLASVLSWPLDCIRRAKVSGFFFLRPARANRGSTGRRGGGGVVNVSHMAVVRRTMDPRVLTLPVRSTSGFHRPDRHRVRLARSAVSRGGGGRVLISCVFCSRMTVETRRGGGVSS